MRLRSKVAVITGGASGIGAAMAKLFSEEGAYVSIIDSQHVQSPPEDALTLLADVRSEEETQSAIEYTADKLGCIDILVNNAGVALRRGIDDTDGESWEKVIDSNLKGAFLCSKHALRFMPRYSAIVHMSSVTGITGTRGRAAYSAAKGALVALTRTMAMDYAGRGIRVNCICPGFVRTPMTQVLTSDRERCDRLTLLHPLGRLGEPEDIAKAALFLVSEESSWITGHALVVDGGFSAGHAVEI